MKNIFTTISMLLTFYILFCLFIYLSQKRLIFFPSKQVEQIPDSVEEVFIMTADDVQLYGWYFNQNSHKTVLFCYGNAGNVSNRIQQLEVFEQLNLNAFLFDYRSYGKSNGVIKSEKDLSKDAEAVYAYLLVEKNLNPEDIIIWGRSLGGAIALDIAQFKDVHAVVLESTFYSMAKMAKEQYWFLPTGLLLRFHFNNRDKIGNLSSKILIIHSKEDEIIPFRHGWKLFEAGIEPKQFLEIAGSHNYGFQQSYHLYMNGLRNFLHE